MPKIRTLGDRASDQESGSDDDDQNRQGFYVGGSEHSGQQVLGPPGRGGRDRDFAASFFDAAQRAGAEAVTGEDAGRDEVGGPQMQEVRMYMWTNGFSIDDGPLRSFEDPASRTFLENIMQGRIPAELRDLHPGKQVDLRMERKTEEYRAPKPKPFGGAGHRLGAVVPDVVVATSSAASSSTAKPAEDHTAAAQAEVGLEEGAPISQIQARLPSGNRVVGRFNHTHTVGTVRTFLVSAVPELAYSPFQLMTTFPNKVIEDETLTLKDAGLINAVVVVKNIA
ncbi:unnamed protein product, partial [Mesorhabditis spiculigera]